MSGVLKKGREFPAPAGKLITSRFSLTSSCEAMIKISAAELAEQDEFYNTVHLVTGVVVSIWRAIAPARDSTVTFSIRIRSEWKSGYVRLIASLVPRPHLSTFGRGVVWARD